MLLLDTTNQLIKLKLMKLSCMIYLFNSILKHLLTAIVKRGHIHIHEWVNNRSWSYQLLIQHTSVVVLQLHKILACPWISWHSSLVELQQAVTNSSRVFLWLLNVVVPMDDLAWLWSISLICKVLDHPVAVCSHLILGSSAFLLLILGLCGGHVSKHRALVVFEAFLNYHIALIVLVNFA